jgi:hypothetical protein
MRLTLKKKKKSTHLVKKIESTLKSSKTLKMAKTHFLKKLNFEAFAKKN